CTRCGKCTAVCPTKAIEETVFVQRRAFSEGSSLNPTVVREVMQGSSCRQSSLLSFIPLADSIFSPQTPLGGRLPCRIS
ncbi:MAG TPA: hypothetical protein ENI11_02260, partial [Actinobacteria bacterium]|nr:hypothetical protein [Actinomycetota bacterium]